MAIGLVQEKLLIFNTEVHDQRTHKVALTEFRPTRNTYTSFEEIYFASYNVKTF